MASNEVSRPGTDGGDDEERPQAASPAGRSRAAVRFAWGRARFEADVDFTPATLVAIGGMVGLILLSVAPIITAAGKARRRS